MSSPDDKPETNSLGEGKWVRLVKRGKWEYAVRIRGHRAAMIVPVTAQGTVILIEQPRMALDAHTIEFPAGLVGDEADDEATADAAGRELIEETGYRASELIDLGEGCSSAGITDEMISAYLATGLERVGEGGGVDGEDITVHEVALDGVETWLAEQVARGCVVDLKVYAGLYWAHRHLGTVPQ